MGQICVGSLSDTLSPWILAFLTSLLTSFATFVFWGLLSRNFAGMLAYGISYGALAGGWSSLLTGFVRPLASMFLGPVSIALSHGPLEDNPARVTTLFGIFLLTRGIGNILSTPISTALSEVNTLSVVTGNVTTSPYTSTDPALGFDVANGRYARMIVYVGTCFAGTGLIAIIGWGVDAYGRRGMAE